VEQKNTTMIARAYGSRCGVVHEEAIMRTEPDNEAWPYSNQAKKCIGGNWQPGHGPGPNLRPINMYPQEGN
jgi:hypothetical protein